MRPTDPEFRTAQSIIQRKARALAQTVEFRDLDEGELQQILMTALLERWPAYDATRSKPATFVQHIVSHAVFDLRRHRQAQRRDIRRERQLPQTHDHTSMDVDADESRARRGISADDSVRDSDLREDLRVVFSQLPPDLALLAELFMVETPTEVARRTGIPRTSLYTDLGRLRSAMKANDLDQYL